MTFDRLVEDCNNLIEYLRNRFNTQKVFLVGHSAGSIIGNKTAHKYPEKIYAYVGVGQIAYSGVKLPPIPVESCHLFRRKVATHSG
jgi:pimeloyl-ACP methyl ester carboxylesterase